MIKNSLLAAVIISLIISIPAFSLDEILLPIPPIQILDSGESTISQELWFQVEKYYSESIIGIEAISISQIVSKWQGDIIAIDFYDISEAMRLGQEFDADIVLLTELGEDGDVKMVKVDPWTGESSEEVVARSVIESLRKLEFKSWIYGTQFSGNLQNYSPPDVAGGVENLSEQMHKKGLFPQEALIQGMGCRAEISVIVSNNGVPIEVKIKRVNQSDFEFEEAFEHLLWDTKFVPARMNNINVVGILEATIQVKTFID
jgi:hypothetical protein